MSVFIIAEAGVNHNGSLELAKKMVDVAKNSGADAIKFQTFKAEKLVSKSAPKADYQIKYDKKSSNQLEMLKKLELNYKAHEELINYCKAKNIKFMSTPFDFDSIDQLNRLGLEIFKIPSGEITNLPYLRKIGKLNKKVILSTGMSKIGEVEDALEVLTLSGTDKSKITVLHANTEYPTPYEDVNLKAMLTIKSTFNIKVGYSDHTLGIEVDIAAVALGASIIEKHFTLDRNMEGPDHKASLEPFELDQMVQSIRNIELALGSTTKKPSRSEQKNITLARKSIFADKDIKEGQVITEEMLTTKRPANGLSPMLWDSIIGQIAKKDYKKGDLIER